LLVERFPIRDLDRQRDDAAVRDFYRRAADYVLFETGRPGDGTVDEFFTGYPPGGDPAASRRLGLFSPEGNLVGIAELGFGFPEPADAYLGLMLLDPAHRGRGLGREFLAHVVALARERGAPRLLLAVLDENARGRVFWEREGFRVVLTAPAAAMGKKVHVRHRMELRL
jgi:GNAT superfamily N-acetyltransferase